MALSNTHALAEIATDGILNSLFAGLAIALLAWAVTRVFDRKGSNTRFAVWFSALVAIALLPCVYHFGASHGAAVSSASHSFLTLPASFASYLFIAWIIGASLGLMRVALGLYKLRSLRSTCTPVALSQYGATVRAALADAQKHRRVAVCSSNSIRVPAAIGYFRPIVMLPDWALQEIPPAELEAILLHELEHLRRWDDWTNLAQKIVKAVFFFHPAVWFIERRLTLEREMACDDAVLAANFNPRAYAESLVGLAEKSFLRRGVQLAQAAVGHVQQLKMRLAEILRKDKARQGSIRLRIPAVALMAIATSFSVYSVTRGPRLFAFSTDQPQLASAAAGYQIDALPNEARLQPVNVSLVANQPANIAVREAAISRPRIVVRRASKPPVAIAQREAEQQFIATALAAPPIPMMVLSDFMTARNAQSNVMPPAVLLVVQSEQLGVNGPVSWRLTVFQLTPHQQHIVAGGVPTKI